METKLAPYDLPSEKDLAAIGRVAIEAARLEEIIDLGIAVALGKAGELGQTPAGWRPAKVQLERLRVLIEEKKGSVEGASSVLEGFPDIQKAALGALDDRNTLMHGFPFWKGEETTSFTDGTTFSDGTAFSDLQKLYMQSRRDAKQIPLDDAPSIAMALVRTRERLLVVILAISG